MLVLILLNPIDSIRVWSIEKLNADFIFGPEFLILKEWGESGMLTGYMILSFFHHGTNRHSCFQQGYQNTGVNKLTANRMVLNIANLSKKYGKKQVLVPTDLSIYDGECVVLCGGNGAGKSTLIKLITGIEKPTTGGFEFTVDHKKKFGFMPDQMYFSQSLQRQKCCVTMRIF